MPKNTSIKPTMLPSALILFRNIPTTIATNTNIIFLSTKDLFYNKHTLCHQIENSTHCSRLQYDYKRYSYHKSFVLGLMSYTKHCKIHSDRAAEYRPDKESSLSYSALFLYCSCLIYHCNDHSNDRYGKKVYPAPHDQFLGKLSLRPTTRLKVPSFLVSLQK